MPPPGKVAALPAEVRERLDALIVEKGFGDYAGLADWLSGQGHPMHKATVARHGKALRRRIERLQAAGARAEALLDGAPEDFGAVAEASLAQVQASLLESLLEADGGEPRDLAAAARALVQVVRAASAVRGEREKARERILAGRSGPEERRLSMEAVRRIREQVYGLRGDPPE